MHVSVRATRLATRVSHYLAVTSLLLVLTACQNAALQKAKQAQALQELLANIAASEGVPDPKDMLPCHLTRVADLPIHMADGHLLIDTSVNGKPASLVFDTGAANTILTRKAAHRLGLRTEFRGYETVEGIGGQRTADMSRADKVQVGFLHGDTWRFLVADVTMTNTNLPPDGLLGADFLMRYDTDIDLPANKIVIYFPEHDCRQPSAFMNGPLYSVPLEQRTAAQSDPKASDLQRALAILTYPMSPTPRIRVTVGAKTLLALIDSGAPDSILFLNGAARLGLTTAQIAADRRAISGGIGPNLVPAVLHKMETITIGDLELSNLSMVVVNYVQPQGVDMILGLNVLRRIHGWISHSSRTFIMQAPPSPSPEPQPANAPAKQS